MTDPSEIYAEMKSMLKEINRSGYEANMVAFREKYADVLCALLNDSVEDGGKKSAERLAECVTERFNVKGKIPGYLQADINSFTVYYVLPAIDLTCYPQSEALIREICAVWKKQFRHGAIHFATYDTISNSFQRTFLGIRL